MKNLSLIVLYLIAFGLFFLKGIFYLDPDFGWHLKMGELILNQGLPQTDPFSYTMPSYPFIDHEWLIDIMIIKLYVATGTWGLASLFALIATIPLWIVGQTKASLRFKLIPLILAVPILLAFGGIRPQVISWALFAILLQIIFSSDKKWRLILPLLFLIWVNLHGGFAIGIVTLILVFGLEGWNKKKISWADLAILFFSFGATLLNPYGVRIWLEIWNTFSDNSLRWSVSEWLPIFFRLDFGYILLLVLSSLLVFWHRGQIDRFKLFLFGLFLIAGLSSQRNVPFWVFIAVPLTAELLGQFYAQVVVNKDIRWRFWRVYKISLACIFVLVALQSYFLIQFFLAWQENSYYPASAVNFLKTQSLQGEIFAPYEWGGYLIWKLPSKKTFVDGRMPSWKRESAPAGESLDAYKEYRQIIFSEVDPLPVLKKYNVNYVLWRDSKPNQGELDKFLQRLLGQQNKKDFIEQIRVKGVKIIYQDQIATIYEL